MKHGGVRRIVTFGAAWLGAAAVAVAVAWQGVGIVTRNVTDERPASLAASDVRDLLDAADPSPSSAPRSTTTDSALPASPTAAPATSQPATAATPPTATTPTTARAPSPTTSVAATAPTSTTTAPPSAPAETRTYNVVGGSVALRFTPEGVTVLWATPNAGFDVDVEPENTNGVKVEFESDAHRSRVDGWWADGPQDRVREEAR